jgi:8-oxo-dGTP diphosphatase
VLDLISAQAIRTRYKAYLDFEGKLNLMEYVTRPTFEIKENRTI